MSKKDLNEKLFEAVKIENINETSLQIIKKLVKQGADVNAKDKIDNSLLHYLVRFPMKYSLDIIKYLLKQGADVHSRHYGDNLLHTIIKAHFNEYTLPIVKCLVKYGVNLYAKDGVRCFPISYLYTTLTKCKNFINEKEKIREVYKKECDDYNGRWFYEQLMMAEYYLTTIPPIIKFLTRMLKVKKELNEKLLKELDGLKGANENTLEIIKELVEQGANVNFCSTDGFFAANWFALHLVLLDINEHTLDIVKYLVSHKADVHVKNSFHRTPLGMVVASETNEYTLPIVKYLAEKGASVGTRDFSGNSPLHYIVRQPNEYALDIVKYLVEHGAYVNAEGSFRRTPVHEALCLSTEYSVDIIKYLLKEGASIPALSSEEYRNLKETLYLQSIPGFAESLRKARAEPIEECAHKLDW